MIVVKNTNNIIWNETTKSNCSITFEEHFFFLLFLGTLTIIFYRPRQSILFSRKEAIRGKAIKCYSLSTKIFGQGCSINLTLFSKSFLLVNSKWCEPFVDRQKPDVHLVVQKEYTWSGYKNRIGWRTQTR